jgi:glycosyltransferase involved in cell wall biosynthesis
MSKNNLNILVINWQDITHPRAGGAEVHFHEIFKRVAENGHRVRLLCCKYPAASARETIDGIEIIRAGNRQFFNLYVPFYYKKLKKDQDYDIVIDDINKIPFYTPLYVNRPICAISHHFFGKSIYLETTVLPATIVFCAEKLVPFIYRNTPFAVVSKSTKMELREQGVRSTIDLLPNAVDTSVYKSIQDSKSAEPVIGYFGRLKKYKSIEHLFLVFPLILERVPNAHLMIVGDGDDKPRLEKMAENLGIREKVTFTGYVSTQTKVELLNKMWLAVNTSPKEGWGLTVIEANACGTPVVASNSPGLCDSVVDGKTGILYEYGNTSQLSEKILSLINNPEQRRSLSQEAIRWAKKFNWDYSAHCAIEIMKRIIDQ